MEPEINPTEEALLMQSIEQNDKLDEIAKTNEASVLEQASTTEAIKELTPALEAILIKLDEVASRETQKVELVGPQITAIKGDKGDKGNTPTTEELEGLIKPLLPTTDDLLDIIEPLIPEPIKGDDGEDYILTENDKKEIASFIEVPIVEKVIEKTVIEKPVTIDKTKTVIKEVAKYESADDIVAKLNTLKKAIDFSVIKNFPDRQAYFGGNTQVESGISNITGFIIDGTNTTVSGSGTLADPYAINATGGGTPALTQNYVGFGDASNLLTGDASFQYLIDTHSLQFGESSIALISASNRGAFAHGYAVGDGFGIFASSDGSSASGYVDNGIISATSNGAFANGYTSANGSLIADGDGSVAFGIVIDSGVVNSAGAGSMAFGSANKLGTVQASGEASFAHGFVDFDGSSIVSSGTGSTASGYATNAFSIMAIGNGSLAGGYTDNGGVSVTGNGAFGWGDKLIVDGDFATAFGSGVTNTTANSFLIGYGGGTGLFVNNSNNVGIGTTTPATTLHVQATAVAATRESVGRFSVSDAATDFLQVSNLTSANSSFSGSLSGITNTVNTLPSINFSGFVTSGNDASDSSSFGIVDFLASRTSSSADPGNGTLTNIVNRKAFTFRSASTTYMTIMPSGNIGIGTTTPAYKLQLSSNFAADDGFSMTDTDGGYFRIVQSTGTAGAFQPIFQGYATGNNSSMIFKGLQTTTGSPTAAVTRFISRASDDSSVVNAATNAFTFENGATTVMAIKGLSVGIGDTSPSSNASRLSIAAGTLTSALPAISITATMPTSGAGTNGEVFTFTGAGSNSATYVARQTIFASGYTGAGTVLAGQFANFSAGTGTGAGGTSGLISYRPIGNQGLQNRAEGTTSGNQIGGTYLVGGGNINIASWAAATSPKNSATNVGLAAFALNTGTSPVQVAGYFALADYGTSMPTFASAALMADNGGTTSDIFVARDNSTTVFTIADGGNVTSTGKIIMSGSASTIRLKSYTVATLPAGTQGDTAYVTDALAPTFLGVVVGGGAVVTPVFYNGTAWVAQ